jgi:hypothetical protein
MKKHKTMKLSDHEFNGILKKAQIPSIPAHWWAHFHRRTMKRLRLDKLSRLGVRRQKSLGILDHFMR